MGTLIAEVKGIANDVKAAIGTLNVRRGREQVWGVLRLVLVPICCVILAWFLNRTAENRTETMLRKQVDFAAEVAKQFRAAEVSQRADMKALEARAREMTK